MGNGSVRLGRRLAGLRKGAGLGVTQVADEARIAPEELTAFESGERLPSAAQLEHLSDAFGMTVGRMICVAGDGPLVTTDKIPFFFSGTGRNIEDARLDKERQQAAQVPYWPLELPDDLTAPELEALMLDWIGMMLNGVYMLSSIVRAAPATVVPEMFRHAVLMMLFEMYPDLTQLAHAMENNNQAGPLAFVLCEKRKGTWDPSRVRFELKAPDTE